MIMIMMIIMIIELCRAVVDSAQTYGHIYYVHLCGGADVAWMHDLCAPQVIGVSQSTGTTSWTISAASQPTPAGLSARNQGRF